MQELTGSREGDSAVGSSTSIELLKGGTGSIGGGGDWAIMASSDDRSSRDKSLCRRDKLLVCGFTAMGITRTFLGCAVAVAGAGPDPADDTDEMDDLDDSELFRHEDATDDVVCDLCRVKPAAPDSEGRSRPMVLARFSCGRSGSRADLCSILP